MGTASGCRGDEGTRFVLGPCRGCVSWRMCVVGGCRGYPRRVSWGLTMSWRCVVEDVRFGTMSWRHVVGTRVQVTISDHVVGVCRGERVSWRCVVGTALGCRGDAGTRFVFGPCRGSVSWRTGVVEVCRGHRLRTQRILLSTFLPDHQHNRAHHQHFLRKCPGT